MRSWRIISCAPAPPGWCAGEVVTLVAKAHSDDNVPFPTHENIHVVIDTIDHHPKHTTVQGIVVDHPDCLHNLTGEHVIIGMSNGYAGVLLAPPND